MSPGCWFSSGIRSIHPSGRGTARGGDEGAWIGALGQLGKTMPKLSGVVWYDVKDSTGDFRVPRSGAAGAAFKAFVRGACK